MEIFIDWNDRWKEVAWIGDGEIRRITSGSEEINDEYLAEENDHASKRKNIQMKCKGHLYQLIFISELYSRNEQMFRYVILGPRENAYESIWFMDPVESVLPTIIMRNVKCLWKKSSNREN